MPVNNPAKVLALIRLHIFNYRKENKQLENVELVRNPFPLLTFVNTRLNVNPDLQCVSLAPRNGECSCLKI